MHAALSTLAIALIVEDSHGFELIWSERYLVADPLLGLQVRRAEPRSQQHLQLACLQTQRLSSDLGCMRTSCRQCMHDLCDPD